MRTLLTLLLIACLPAYGRDLPLDTLKLPAGFRIAIYADAVPGARSMALAELARDFALAHLKPGGAFLVKVFQGAGYEEFHRSLRTGFDKVVVRKPDASRGESAELYVLARGPRGG